jgi:hypothetical protein
MSKPTSIDILDFIKSCIRRGKIYWTYHVNMRLKGRFIPREVILASVDSYEIIEEYPKDKYLPSYLIYAQYRDQIIHIQIAANVEIDRVIIMTAYEPTLDKWKEDFKSRRQS